MTAATANDGTGPFDSTFNLAAAVVAAATFLFGVYAGWIGYQGVDGDPGQLPVLGEMTLLTGMVALTFATAVSLVALWVALYMEPGFGDTSDGHAGEAAEAEEAETEN